MITSTLSSAVLLLARAALISAQCSTLTNPLPRPSLAPGYEYAIIAQNLAYPRAIEFDSAGNLLVLDRGVGVVRYTIDSVCGLGQNKTIIVADAQLNHGMTLSDDGTKLYVSNADIVFQYTYDAAAGVASGRTALVTGMNNTDHVTRTLLVSKKSPEMLLVSRGDNDNLDNLTLSADTGRAQIRAFNVTELLEHSQDYTTTGVLMGWGLRNSVGLDEDAIGQIWSVENSVDDVMRAGVDIHQNNPAEELNYHGSITDKTPREDSYGYPQCFAVWDVQEIPDAGNLTTGDQFSIVSESNVTVDDQGCAENFRAPRLSFEAHMAPLDIKFDTAGNAWVSFHGSVDKADPVGYKVSMVEFSNFEPTAANDSMTAAVDIISNSNNTMCPGACFRPVGLTFDSKGDLYFASDATGEIYVVKKTDGSGVVGSASTTTSPSGSATGAAASATTTAAGSKTLISGGLVFGWAVAVAALMS